MYFCYLCAGGVDGVQKLRPNEIAKNLFIIRPVYENSMALRSRHRRMSGGEVAVITALTIDLADVHRTGPCLSCLSGAVWIVSVQDITWFYA